MLVEVDVVCFVIECYIEGFKIGDVVLLCFFFYFDVVMMGIMGGNFLVGLLEFFF